MGQITLGHVLKNVKTVSFDSIAMQKIVSRIVEILVQLLWQAESHMLATSFVPVPFSADGSGQISSAQQ
jgi:hypothetical protein